MCSQMFYEHVLRVAEVQRSPHHLPPPPPPVSWQIETYKTFRKVYPSARSMVLEGFVAGTGTGVDVGDGGSESWSPMGSDSDQQNTL